MTAVVEDISGIIPWSVALSAVAVILWTAFLVLAIIRREPRGSFYLMALVAILTAVGMLASAWAAAQAGGQTNIRIDRVTLALVAGMGRGALIMGGVFALAAYRGQKDRRR